MKPGRACGEGIVASREQHGSLEFGQATIQTVGGEGNRTPPAKTNRKLAAQAGRLLAGARHIFRVAAAVLVNAFRRQFQHPVGQCGQEVTIM